MAAMSDVLKPDGTVVARLGGFSFPDGRVVRVGGIPGTDHVVIHTINRHGVEQEMMLSREAAITVHQLLGEELAKPFGFETCGVYDHDMSLEHQQVLSDGHVQMLLKCSKCGLRRIVTEPGPSLVAQGSGEAPE